jgi:hypothetical protein
VVKEERVKEEEENQERARGHQATVGEITPKAPAVNRINPSNTKSKEKRENEVMINVLFVHF